MELNLFEALRLSLLSQFSFIQSTEYVIPFAWLTIGFIFVFFIKKILGCTSSWQGPADAIYCAHRLDRNMDIRQGFGTVFAAFTSLSAGASRTIWPYSAHGALIGGLFRKYNLASVNLSNDIFLGCGVAAAISAGFQAPIAGVIFAHEAILRHFSVKAVAPIAISSICAASVGEWLNLNDNILVLNFVPEPLIKQVPALLVGGLLLV